MCLDLLLLLLHSFITRPVCFSPNEPFRQRARRKGRGCPFSATYKQERHRENEQGKGGAHARKDEEDDVHFPSS